MLRFWRYKLHRQRTRRKICRARRNRILTNCSVISRDCATSATLICFRERMRKTERKGSGKASIPALEHFGLRFEVDRLQACESRDWISTLAPQAHRYHTAYCAASYVSKPREQQFWSATLKGEIGLRTGSSARMLEHVSLAPHPRPRARPEQWPAPRAGGADCVEIGRASCRERV